MTDSLPDLIRRWQTGWGVARELPPAAEADGALHVLFGQRTRHSEIIVLDLDAVPALAARVAASAQADWLTVITADPSPIIATLEQAGLEVLDDTEAFMAIELADHPALGVAAPYELATAIDGAVIAAVATNGERAASGVMAVTGSDGIAHNIETDPAHRRRGLAGAVMSALAREAVTRGATTGLLIASYEGQQLYTSLGWRTVAGVVVARRASADESGQ